MLTVNAARLPREIADQLEKGPPPLELTLPINGPIVSGYLSQFEHADWAPKATAALKVGVIAIQSASPTLDMRVVQEKFGEVETRFKDFVGEFQEELTGHLGHYFKDKDGQLPRSLDPKNKDGVIMLIEAKMQELLESRLNEVLAQFSLDEDNSAMSRFKALFDEGFQKINLALGVKDAKAAEAVRGHVKGIEFEADLYEVFAETGRQLGDDTEFVRGTPGEMLYCQRLINYA